MKSDLKHRFEDELASWAEYREVFDTVREPLLLLSSDFRIIAANRAFYSCFKVDEEETCGRIIYEIGDNQWDIPTLRTLLDDILPKHSSLEDYEVRHHFKGIGHRVMLLNARRIAKRNVILLAMEDVTDRFRYREEIERSNKAHSVLTAIASHDLKEPLRMVTMFLSLIEKEFVDAKEPRLHEYLAYAIDGAERMTALIHQLADNAEAGRAPCRELVDLNVVFTQTIENLRESIAETGAKVTSTILPTVLGDPSELLQLFQNLVSNALKYHGDASPEVKFEARMEETKWLISIRDNGMGIPEDQCRKIFDPFFRLHSKQEIPGTGLGLATCKKIVESLGGRIWVESRLNVGSTFFLELPALPRLK